MRKIVFDFNGIDNSELISEPQNTSKRVKSNTEEMYEYNDRIQRAII